MKFTRRQAMRFIGSAVPAVAMRSQLGRAFAQSAENGVQVTPGRFTGARASLKAYTIPDWFADAKFGIWADWGPQSAVGDGDWYARNMHIQGSPQNLYHVDRFGPRQWRGHLLHASVEDQWRRSIHERAPLASQVQ